MNKRNRKSGHVEFAMLLWIILIAALVAGWKFDSNVLMAFGVVFLLLGFTHPYFICGLVNIVVAPIYIGWCLVTYIYSCIEMAIINRKGDKNA